MQNSYIYAKISMVYPSMIWMDHIMVYMIDGELIYDIHTTACSTAAASTVMDSYGAPTDRYIYGEPEDSSASAWV